MFSLLAVWLACVCGCRLKRLGNEGMRGEAIAGTIFIACPVQKPLMIALSVQAARKGHIGQARIFDHVIKKPPKVRGLARLVANARL